jgi:hypothetical protein
MHIFRLITYLLVISLNTYTISYNFTVIDIISWIKFLVILSNIISKLFIVITGTLVIFHGEHDLRQLLIDIISLNITTTFIYVLLGSIFNSCCGVLDLNVEVNLFLFLCIFLSFIAIVENIKSFYTFI